MINNSIHDRFSKTLGITDPHALREIIQATQITSIAKGETFIHQHDLADTMAVVLDGRLLVRKKTSDGNDTFVGRIFPGESVGETGLLSPHRRRNAEVVAQRDSKLGVINIEKFKALLMNRPEVLLTLMRTILERELHKAPSQTRRSLEFSSAKANHMPSISLLCDNQNRLLILVADSSKPQWTRFVQNYCDGAYIFSSHSREQRRSQKETILQPVKPPSLRILDHRRGSSFDQVVLPPKVDLSDPLFIIACDIQGSKEVRFTQGYLYDAVRPNISIPGIFYPVIRNNQTLVDGGVINNLPMDVMRQRIGKGVVFGSDLGSSTTNRDHHYFMPEGDGISGLSQLLHTIFSHSSKLKTPGLSDILMKTFEVNTRKKLETIPSPRDTLISLDLSHIDPMDFRSYKRIIEEGYEQTLKQLDSMEKV